MELAATGEPLSIFSLKLGERFPESPFCLLRLTRSSLVIPRISFARFQQGFLSPPISPPIFSSFSRRSRFRSSFHQFFQRSILGSLPFHLGSKARHVSYIFSIQLNLRQCFFGIFLYYYIQLSETIILHRFV